MQLPAGLQGEGRALGAHDGGQRTADARGGGGGTVCRMKDALGTGLASGSRRRSGEPWRAAETALSRPHGDTVRNTVHPWVPSSCPIKHVRLGLALRQRVLPFLARHGGLEFDQAARSAAVPRPARLMKLLAAAQHGAMSAGRVHSPPPAPDLPHVVDRRQRAAREPQVMATKRICIPRSREPPPRAPAA